MCLNREIKTNICKNIYNPEVLQKVLNTLFLYNDVMSDTICYTLLYFLICTALILSLVSSEAVWSY